MIMKKTVNTKLLILKISFDRLIITILIIFTALAFIRWIFLHWIINDFTSKITDENNIVNNTINTVLTEVNLSSNESVDTANEHVYILDESENPEEYVIENFDILYQLPELPTGCEITALTMILNYYDCEICKTEMAEYYLPKTDYDIYYDDNHVLIGPDIDNYFIGDPESENGYVCGCQAIKTAANSYFDDTESNYYAVDLTGLTLNELYNFISKDTPVFVLVTIGMEDRFEPESWYTEDGKLVEWSTNDHGAVLIGYSDETVTIADPIAGIIEYEREQFENVYIERGRKCVVIQNPNY